MLAWRCDRCKKYFCGTSLYMKMTPTIQVQLKGSKEVELRHDPAGKTIECDLCNKCARDIYEEVLDPKRMKIEEETENEH